MTRSSLPPRLAWLVSAFQPAMEQAVLSGVERFWQSASPEARAQLQEQCAAELDRDPADAETPWEGSDQPEQKSSGPPAASDQPSRLWSPLKVLAGLWNRLPGQLRAVAPQVVGLPLSLSNLYLVGTPQAGDRGWVLVDTGVWGSAGLIRETADKLFGRGARPAAIILTHGHFDHVGDVAELARGWQTPVYAHRLELPYLSGLADYPPPDPTVDGGLVARVFSRFFPRSGINLGSWIHPLPADGRVPGLPDWRWIHTPGHTPGHVSLFRERDRVLLAGDAFVTLQQESLFSVLTGWRQVSRPPAYFTMDWTSAARSVERLARLQPEVAATGHGFPMFGRVLRQQLWHLALNFEQEAIPSSGRYVRLPALSDKTGPRFVPPAPIDPLPYVVGGLALVAAAGWLWASHRRSQRSLHLEPRTNSRSSPQLQPAGRI